MLVVWGGKWPFIPRNDAVIYSTCNRRSGSNPPLARGKFWLSSRFYGEDVWTLWQTACCIIWKILKVENKIELNFVWPVFSWVILNAFSVKASMPVSGGTSVWPQKKSSFQRTAAQIQRMSKVSLDFSASSLARISACIYFLVRNPKNLTFVPSALKR